MAELTLKGGKKGTTGGFYANRELALGQHVKPRLTQRLANWVRKLIRRSKER